MTEMIKMQPLGDYILLKKIVKEKPPGTIITLHELDANEPQYQVISIGPDANKNITDSRLLLMKDCIVYISKYNTHPLKIDNQEFLLVKKEHVLGVVNA